MKSRKKIVAGNWKMNATQAQAIDLIEKMGQEIKKIPQIQALPIIIPSFLHIPSISKLCLDKEFHFFLGAQNCSSFEWGAYTGEISAPMLHSYGMDYVIIGHSERRQYFNETSETLSKKIKIALKNHLIPIYCCGELLVDREKGEEQAVIFRQLKEVLFDLSLSQISQVVIAYEPVWAIGTGKTATVEQAQQMQKFIRGTLSHQYSASIAEMIPLLYGGSCNAKNAKELFSMPDIDGGLIGGASLDAQAFLSILTSF